MRLVLITHNQIAVYEGKKQIAVFESAGIELTPELIEEIRNDKY